MQQQEISYLLQLYMENRLTPAETAQLQELLANPANTPQLADALQQLMEADEGEGQTTVPAMDAVLENILSVDRTGQPAVLASLDSRAGKTARFRFRWQWAAAVVLACTLAAAGWFILRKKTDTAAGSLARNNAHGKTNIVPGSDKAVLTLADGSVIALNDVQNGLISRQGAAQVMKTDSGRLAYYTGNHTGTPVYNTISTPKGGQYQITLPDATRVWLNAASSLRFPTAFTGNNRVVELTGEAYFEVAAAANQPFIVKAGAAQVQVLGTHFNINAYDDEESIQTTLLEGAVKMSLDQQAAVLKPGQQGGYNKNSRALTTREVDTREAIAWKEGYYLFNRTSIPSAMRQIARWYDVEVAYEGAIPRDEIVGKIPRAANIAEVLHIMELIGVRFKIEGRKITVLS